MVNRFKQQSSRISNVIKFGIGN